jgi:glycosyltransferase involved in cell wall biosynthesis
MTISVIIPNYNHAAFLRQRIESVLNQNYPDFEVILLDDCSTDNSREIIESYRNHPKVSHIIYNEVNSGSTFLQWEKGIQLSRGEWIWVAESDDFSNRDLLARLVANLHKNDHIVLSYCQSNEVDENNNILGTMENWTNDVDPVHWSSDYINSGGKEVEKYLVYKNTIPNASAVIFKKAAYENAGKGHMKMRYCGDWLLWINLLSTGDISYTATPLNFFRKHQSTTRKMSSPEKLRKRLEEEYEMLLYIKDKVGISRQEFKKRLKWILNLYKHSFSRKQLMALLIPFNYKGKIPYYRLVVHLLTKNRLKAG